MQDKVINNITATVRFVSEDDVAHMQYGLLPYMGVGDIVNFSMNITDGLVAIEFSNFTKAGDNMIQLFDNLASFFECYDTDIRFVLTEKFGDTSWEMGELLEN